ncbi:sensor histidine kinase [Corticibacter populi]|uniref:sensor histidine kinase n=1 Tax=Corticibacter populi TaxID=1550736 RepID=UPI0010DFABCF|nr:histidine kinase [Corticibacter populi]RZS33561.1 two-component system sensor histidine kinase AlgZ [Corticibacter populi]
MRGSESKQAKEPILAGRRRHGAAVAWAAQPSQALLFDACQIGVVLRAIVLVELPLALIALFGAASAADWLAAFALATGVALPALLAWLLVACSLRHWMGRQAASVQWAFAVLLGWLCGMLAAALAAYLGLPAGPGVWLAAGFSGIVLAAVLTQMLALRQRARQPAATVARLAELQSRIRPHFLFNTLNSAIALVRQDPPAAERMLEDLSDLFHHALKDPGSESSLEKELEIARQYLRIEGIRFGERLRVRWSVDDDALGASVPPLLLQPLVENAIKHGIEPSAQGGEIHVLVRRKGARVYVRISNTVPPVAGPGAAVTSTAGNGIALQNVRARLHLLHDMDADFRQRLRDGRYEVGMVLPAKPLPATPGVSR